MEQSDAAMASQLFMGRTAGVNKKELRNHFEAYGIVSSVHLADDCAGRRLGFGGIQFKHATSVQQAVVVGLHHIGGRLVTVQPMRQNLHLHVSESTNIKSQPATDNPLKSLAGQDTHTRQTQAQHSDSVSEFASIGLLDVLCQVPALPQLLTPDSQKALSVPCKSCHAQFSAQVQVVTVVRAEDYPLVLERRWPRLIMVILRHNKGAYRVPPPPPNIRIFTIHVSAGGSGKSWAAIFMLKPLHNLAIDLPWTHLAAQQLALQMRLRWPLMDSFTMCHVHDLGLEPGC